MGASTGIGWTDATANFIIGCQSAGRGCDLCYAEVLAANRFGIIFGPNGERRETKVAFTSPLKWQHMHDHGCTHFKQGKNADGSPNLVPVPVWVFACSLSDFFDNKWPTGVRARAWEVIRKTQSLRWQIVTKRVGNVETMLPADWGDNGYPNVGIIATVVDQQEYDRDAHKLHALYRLGVRWTGLSIEPQLDRVVPYPHFRTDWIITGGESSQGGKVGRPYDIGWAGDLIRYGRRTRIPVFVKQLGAQPYVTELERKISFASHLGKHDVPENWPLDLRVQEMPRVYDLTPPRGFAAA